MNLLTVSMGPLSIPISNMITIVSFLSVSAAVFPGCRRTTGDCQNGTCVCSTGDSCDFICSAPPCAVRCEGDNSTCNGECANSTCTCESGSHCAFTCQSPPCHVSCSASTTCSGTCADGQCDCGAGSTCTFTCASSPCHSTCAAGAHCLVMCPAGRAGTQDCDLTQCATGAPVICPGAGATTCGSPCP